MESERIRCEIKEEDENQIIKEWNEFLENCGIKYDQKQEIA